MPRIPPPGGEVDWPEAEGVLGVVGVAPWATLDFCRALYEAVDARKDWHFPRLLLDINTKLPSRGRHLELGETDPSPAIQATIRELAAAGATLVVVVCNTAHLLYERWARESPVPVLHILEEAVRQAAARGARRIAPLHSISLARSDLYGRQVEAAGLACHRLAEPDQTLVGELIAGIKLSGRVAPEHEPALRELLARLASGGVDTVLGGCTELSVLAPYCAEAGLDFVDSNVALARAALSRLGLPPALLRS